MDHVDWLFQQLHAHRCITYFCGAHLHDVQYHQLSQCGFVGVAGRQARALFTTKHGAAIFQLDDGLVVGHLHDSRFMGLIFVEIFLIDVEASHCDEKFS
jgi:hypothetical protein